MEGEHSTLIVKTDLSVTANAVCVSDHMFQLTTSDTVNYLGNVYFDGNETQRCVYSVSSLLWDL